MTDLVSLHKFKLTLDNIQLQLTDLREDVSKSIQALTYNEPIKELFRIKQIPLPENMDKTSCEVSILCFAEQQKWRQTTTNKTLEELDSIFIQNHESKKIITKKIKTEKKTPKSQLSKFEKHEDHLRKQFLKFGIHIGNDFKKETLLELVHKKASELKWRNKTLEKNLITINKILNTSPIVIKSIKIDYNDSDSDASFIEYITSALENMQSTKNINNIIIEQNDAFVDEGQD